MKIDTVCERLTEYIKIQIITGKFSPGERISELGLAAQLSVSTASLREALNSLQTENLVVRAPRKGVRVSGTSFEDCEHLWKTREMLECGAIDFLKARDTRNFPKAAAALEAGSPICFSDLDDMKKKEMLQKHNPFPDFHIALIESTDNTYLIQMYRSISSSLARYQFMAFESVPPDDMSRTTELIQKDHLRILGLLQQGDYEEAKIQIKAHIFQTYLVIKGIIP